VFDWVVMLMLVGVWALSPAKTADAASNDVWLWLGPLGCAVPATAAWLWTFLVGRALVRHARRPVEQQLREAEAGGEARTVFGIAARGDAGVGVCKAALAAWFLFALAMGWSAAAAAALHSPWTAAAALVIFGAAVAVAVEASRLAVWRGWTALRRAKRRPFLRELAAFVAQHLRQRVALLLILAAAGALWTLALATLSSALQGRYDIALAALDLAGLAALVLALPRLLTLVWPTRPVKAGPLLDAIDAVERAARVPLGRPRLWTSPGTGVNAAMVGFARLERVLLISLGATRALSPPELEAVLAHEAAHAQRRHALWLALGVAGAVGLGWLLGRFTGDAAATLITTAADTHPNQPTPVAFWGAHALAAAAGLLMFGVMSRAFEREADAVAAQTLTTLERRRTGPAAHASDAETTASDDGDAPQNTTVSRDAAALMAETLGTVARVNGMRVNHWGFRHGSIAQRFDSLRRTAGRTVRRSPAGAAARRVRLAALLLLLLAVAAWSVPL